MLVIDVDLASGAETGATTKQHGKWIEGPSVNVQSDTQKDQERTHQRDKSAAGFQKDNGQLNW